jgi:hypothetical protein
VKRALIVAVIVAGSAWATLVAVYGFLPAVAAIRGAF